MSSKKQNEAKQDEQFGVQNRLICQGCGRTVKAETCSWEEDDGGKIYCRDCLAEKESCGCSD